MWLDYYILATTIIYGVSVLSWLINAFILPYFAGLPDREVGQDQIQLRILTVDNESVVNRTIRKASEVFDDIVVISEKEIDVADAENYAVPSEFECDAIRKGRALEWARLNIETDKEFVVYIDEDTIIEDFNGMPDADIVQFRESPVKTSSLLSYLTDIHRIGYQIEQRAFGVYKYPLYAWGGGIAIRQCLEQKVTWNYKTITEDTSFAWRAAEMKDEADEKLDFQMINTDFFNQAPTSLRSLFSQRRRWISGTLIDIGVLPFRYRLLVYVRVILWCFSPIVFLNGLLIYFFSTPIADELTFIVVVALELLVLHVMSYAGLRHSTTTLKQSVLVFVLTILVSVINSVGAVWGLFDPAKDFAVTKKQVIEEAVEEVKNNN